MLALYNAGDQIQDFLYAPQALYQISPTLNLMSSLFHNKFC